MVCSRKHNQDHRLLINENFIEIDPVVLELWVKKLANSETNFWKFTQLTCSVVFIPISLKSGVRPPRSVLDIWNLLLEEINLSIIRHWYCALNPRIYVRCTFYFFFKCSVESCSRTIKKSHACVPQFENRWCKVIIIDRVGFFWF